MNGKGSKRRPGSDDTYRKNWDRIFNKKKLTAVRTNRTPYIIGLPPGVEPV